MMFKAILLLALVGLAAAATDDGFKDQNITFKFDDGPSFTFFDNDDKSEDFTFAFATLEEMNNGDSVHKVTLNAQDGKWDQKSENFTQYTSSFNAGGNTVSFLVNATFFTEEGTVELGSNKIHVPENSLKWTLHIDGWKLKDENSTLVVSGTGFASNGTTSEWKNDKNLIIGSKKHWMWVSFPDVANTQYNDDASNYNATVVVNATDTTNNNTRSASADFTIELPYFVSDVAYDPSVTITDTSSPTTSDGSNNLILLIIAGCVAGAVVAIILAFVVVLLLRRKRSQYEAV